jgi:hypothetical protein
MPRRPWNNAGKGGGYNKLMDDETVEREAPVDPDEAVREEMRAKLREMNAEKPDQRKRKGGLSKAEESAIGPSLLGGPGFPGG